MIPLLIGAAAGAVGTLAVSKLLSKDKDFFTIKEVAELLKISEYTLRKKIRDGELKAEPGKSYRISKRDLEEYLHTAELQGMESEDSFSPEILAQIMELKELDLQKLKLQLQKLELESDEHEPKEFQKRKLALEIEITELEAAIKTQQILKTIGESSSQKN